MTLREIGRSISDAWNGLFEVIEASQWMISNLSPVDWPLWLLGIVGLFVLMVLWFLLGVHQTEDGKVRRGWWLIFAWVAKIVYIYAVGAMLALWMGLVIGSVIWMVDPAHLLGSADALEPTYPRWYGAIGLLIAAGLAVAARLGFRAYDRRNPDKVERPEN